MPGVVHPTDQLFLNTLLDQIVKPKTVAEGIIYQRPTAIVFRKLQGQRSDDFYCRVAEQITFYYLNGQYGFAYHGQARANLYRQFHSTLTYFATSTGKWYR